MPVNPELAVLLKQRFSSVLPPLCYLRKQQSCGKTELNLCFNFKFGELVTAAAPAPRRAG